MGSTPLRGYTTPEYTDAKDLPTAVTTPLLEVEQDVVLKFTNSTARDSAVTSPTAGMAAYLTTPKSLTVYDGTNWVAHNSGGVVGYATRTTSQTGITSEVDLTDLSVNVTGQADRLYRVSFCCQVNSSASGDDLRVDIKDGSTAIGRGNTTAPATNRSVTLAASVITSLSSGAHTIKLSAQRGSGSGNMAVAADSGRPAFILVEDIGLS